MGFNADAFLAAREPWTLTLAGRTFEARPVSVQQVLAFQRAVESAAQDPVALTAAMTALLRAMFPARWRYVLGADPVRLVLRLDTAAQTAILADFFGYMVRSQSQQRGTRMTPPSSPSSAPTPRPLLDVSGELTVTPP